MIKIVYKNVTKSEMFVKFKDKLMFNKKNIKN